MLKRHVLPYESLHPDVKKSVDEIRQERQLRVLGGLATSGSALESATSGAIAPVAAAGTAFLALAEKMVIASTRKLGELVMERKAEVFSKEQMQFIEKNMFTHAHVDRKGNIVLTREPSHRGNVIIPHLLRPRWRMKVPLQT